MCVSRRRPPTCLWPDGSPKFVTIVLSVHQIVAPGIVEITVLQKANQTQPLKNQQLYFENEAFLIKRFFFSTLSWFCGLVRPRFKILPSTYRPYVVSTENRHVVLPSRRVPEIWNRSPFIKSSIPGSSKSRCSRKQTKPSLSTTLYFEAFFSISYQNVFLAHFRGFVAFVVLWFGLSKFQNLTVHVLFVLCQDE